jgi:Protein of unknown function (DUF1003)
MLIVSTVAIAGGTVLNLALPDGGAPRSPFPFPLLSAAVSTVGLYLATMILISQRHDDEMATRLEQMTLELAILSEQKSAKIIPLQEEVRRNHPNQAMTATKGRGLGKASRCAGRARRDMGGGKRPRRLLDRQAPRPSAEPESPSGAFLGRPRPACEECLAHTSLDGGIQSCIGGAQEGASGRSQAGLRPPRSPAAAETESARPCRQGSIAGPRGVAGC